MKKPKNYGKQWTKTEDNKIKILAGQGVETKKIAKILERTKYAVEKEASNKNISLKPKDKSGK